VKDNYFVLNDRHDEPGSRFGSELPMAFFAHDECAMKADPLPVLYYIELKRIVEYTSRSRHGDCLTGWVAHLREKNWFLHEMIAGLDTAHTVARRLARTPAVHPPATSAIVVASLPGDARSKVSAKLRLQIFARDGHRCVKCGAQPPLELDHIMPVSRGGSSDPENLQSLCVPCNREKRDSLPGASR
jgi:5-methylcytosine-specific restriction endonuclease McrA